MRDKSQRFRAGVLQPLYLYRIVYNIATKKGPAEAEPVKGGENHEKTTLLRPKMGRFQRRICLALPRIRHFP